MLPGQQEQTWFNVGFILYFQLSVFYKISSKLSAIPEGGKVGPDHVSFKIKTSYHNSRKII